LIEAVIKALQGVNGFSGQCQDEDELQARLVAAGVVWDADDLSAALSRWADSGRLVQPEGRLVMRTTRAFHSSEPFSRVDELAADVVASTNARGDRFDSDEQLAEWLAEDGIAYADAELSEALLQLQLGGLLRRPPDEGWRVPRPGYLSTPSVLMRY
jgi:hypothetical protein